MRKFIMSLTTVASLSLAAVPVLGLTQAANAAEREPVATVSFADLDLSNPSQAAIFKARVDTAGDALCRAKLRNGDLTTTMGACKADVRREVNAQMPKPQRKALAVAARAAAVELAAR